MQVLLLLFFSCAFLCSPAAAQNYWKSYNFGRDVSSIAVDQNGTPWITAGGVYTLDVSSWTVQKVNTYPDLYYHTVEIDRNGDVWAMGLEGLYKLDGATWTKFDQTNSGLNQYLHTFTFDNSGAVWCGMYASLAKYDGAAWVTYTPENSGVPRTDIFALAADTEGNLWMGGLNGNTGLTMFDGSHWTTFTTQNSGLPYDDIRTLKFDNDGTLWIGNETGGLVSFDGTDWTVYNSANAGFPISMVQDIDFDPSGNLWIGMPDGGFAKFDGNTWTAYQYPHDVCALRVDRDGTRWIGTLMGIMAYNESNPFLSIQDEHGAPPMAELYPYPNPFNAATTIPFRIAETGPVSCTIRNLLGQTVRTLVQDIVPAGYHEAAWDGRDDSGNPVSGGLYFYRVAQSGVVQTGKMLLMK